jgi:hypothetical protein
MDISTERKTFRWVDGRINGQTDKQIDFKTDKWADRRLSNLKYTLANVQTNRQMNK